ncbi:MAG TPA: hypothetical protein VEY30_13075 [Myxococcaceae bacterium]|nr:hypothetical protein [Myxococcaceae bacterium]
MRYPPRLGHLATRAVLVAKLAPTYAQAHQVEEDEAADRLHVALSTSLLDDLLAATWVALLGKTKKLDESGLLEKVAGSLKDRPMRPGRKVAVDAGWSSFLLVADLHAGTASDAARRVIESEEGQKRVAAGLAEVAKFLAAELTR